MIKRLRKEFITIAIIAVSSVMVLLFVAVNAANFVSINTKLNNTLDMITENGGNIPDFGREEKPAESGKEPAKNGKAPTEKRDPEFNAETRFDTRYFVLYYTADGTLTNSNLNSIAAVGEDSVDEYLAIALSHGEGYAFTQNYKYKVTLQSDGSYMAVFVHDQREMSSALTLLLVSLAATAGCIVLICVMIVLFSGRAIKPAIESDQKQKQFVTDASHELKTPITVIAANMSVLEMEVGKNKWIDKTKAQTEKLKELVNSLVELARMDEGKTPQFHAFGVSDTVKETVQSFEDFAATKGHSLPTDIAPGITYTGDEYAVRQLCSILLENAVKYASANTPIRFSLQKGKKGIVITSENDCENVQTEELDKLFDRFYRADKARNAETGGFGIGLSVAKSICEAHGGSIKAEMEDAHHIRFVANLK